MALRLLAKSQSYKWHLTYTLRKTHIYLIQQGQALYYKTLNGRNLQIFVIARVFVPGKRFQPSLMFAGKAGAYPSEANFRLAGVNTFSVAPSLINANVKSALFHYCEQTSKWNVNGVIQTSLIQTMIIHEEVPWVYIFNGKKVKES